MIPCWVLDSLGYKKFTIDGHSYKITYFKVYIIFIFPKFLYRSLEVIWTMDLVFMSMILALCKEISSLKWLKCKVSIKITESIGALDSVLVSVCLTDTYISFKSVSLQLIQLCSSCEKIKNKKQKLLAFWLKDL